MSALYDVSGGYWAVVYLTKDISPQVNTDFLVVDKHPRDLPFYYVSDNKKLYLLFEELTSPYELLDLHIKTDITHQVLIHNDLWIYPLKDEGPYPPDLYLSESDNPKKFDPAHVEDIIDLFEMMPRFCSLPDKIKLKFLEKYPSSKDTQPFATT
nr:hypothetical protein [Abalone asfa-like virus]